MNISRRQLERIISEELSSLSEASHGSQFSAAAERGAKSKKAQGKAEAEKELKKTLDWFELTVFPAIEDNQWPIVADEDYAFRGGISGLQSLESWDEWRNYIPKGSKFTDLSSEVKFAGNAPAGTYQMHLEQIYNQMENFVIMHNLNVPMTSVPGEVWSEEKKAAAAEWEAAWSASKKAAHAKIGSQGEIRQSGEEMEEAGVHEGDTVKISRRQLERIIREELQASLLREDVDDIPPKHEGSEGETAETTGSDGTTVMWQWHTGKWSAMDRGEIPMATW
jgi:hypothetical protein